MKRALTALAIATLGTALMPALPISAATTSPTPAPTRTPPPQIYRVLTRPLCADLHKYVAPTLAMMLQNDRTIKDSPRLFGDFNRNALEGIDNSVSNSAPSTGGSTTSAGGAGDSLFNPSQQMTLLKMENMVGPLATNIIAMQKLLDSPALTQPTGDPDDDKRIADIREKLLKSIADQSATLDIINGFVQTQQMADLQHSGEEYIQAVNQPETNSAPQTGPTANPVTQDPNQAGLPPNPYEIQLAAIPGLTLGYNPVTRLLDAVNWTIQQTSINENDASRSIMAGAQECGAGPAPSPAPSASP